MCGNTIHTYSYAFSSYVAIFSALEDNLQTKPSVYPCLIAVARFKILKAVAIIIKPVVWLTLRYYVIPHTGNFLFVSFMM